MTIIKRPVVAFRDPNQLRRDRETINGILDHSLDDYRKRTTAEVLAGVTPVNYAYPPGDVRRYGADTAASAATNRAAIQAAINSNSRILVPEHYVTDGVLNLVSNIIIDFEGDSSITLDDGITDEYIFRGDTVDNIVFIDAVIYGNGLAGLSAVFLEDCTNVQFNRCRIMYAGSMAILLRGCVRILVDFCELSENYFYGIEDKNGSRNRYTNTRFFGNGDTGTVSNSGGRGIVFWMCIDCTAASNTYINNTEYGFRIYAQSDDTSPTRGCHVVDSFFQDNDSADVVLYDESLAGTFVYQNTLRGLRAVRTTAPGLGQSFVLHGGSNVIDDCHVFKEGAFGAFDAFLFYYAINAKLLNCSATNLANAIAFSNTEDCIVDGFLGNGVATACGPGGVTLSGNIIRNSEFVHGGSGTGDVAIISYNATGKNFIENVKLDGFAYGVYLNNEPVSLMHVTTTNSTIHGLRKDGTVLEGQEFIGNSWDSVNPAVLFDIEKIDNRSALVRYVAEPASLTWTRGDEWVSTSPSAAGVPGGMCVTSGTFSTATDNTGDTDGSTAVITGMTDTSDFFAGEYVSVSAGFATTGPFLIVSKTSSSITIDTNSNSAQSNVTVSTPDPVFKNNAALAA